MNLFFKIIGLLCGSLVFITFSVAQININLDLTAEMDVETLYSYTKRPRVVCGRVVGSTKGPFSQGPFKPKSLLSGNIETSQNLYSDLFVNISSGDQNPSKDKLVKKIRTVYADIQINKGNEYDPVSLHIDLKDVRHFDKDNGIISVNGKSKCRFKRWKSAISKPLVRGKLQVSYTVPQNVWLLTIERTRATGLFEFSNIDASEGHRSFKGSLNPFIDLASTEDIVYLWVKPGSTITQDFIYSETYANHHLPIRGEFSINIRPVVSDSITNLAQAKVWFADYQSALKDNASTSNTHNSLGENLKFYKFILDHISLINNESLLQDMVSTISIYDLENIMESLTQGRDHVNFSPDQSHLRIASTILSYRIAQTYISGLLPYCEPSKLKLPYKNIDLDLNWLATTHYLVNKAAHRIKNYNVSALSNLISILYEYQNLGLTYAQIRNDLVEYEKILQAYNIISSTMDLRSSPLKQSYEEILYLFENFDPQAIKMSQTQQILNTLEQLSILEVGLIKDLVSEIRLFQSNNNEQINLTALAEKIQNLEMQISKAIDAIDSSGEIFSISSSGLYKMNEMIITLGVNYISLFEKPFETEFELFRKNFFNSEELKQTREQLLVCLGAKK